MLPSIIFDRKKMISYWFIKDKYFKYPSANSKFKLQWNKNKEFPNRDNYCSWLTYLFWNISSALASSSLILMSSKKSFSSTSSPSGTSSSESELCLSSLKPKSNYQLPHLTYFWLVLFTQSANSLLLRGFTTFGFAECLTQGWSKTVVRIELRLLLTSGGQNLLCGFCIDKLLKKWVRRFFFFFWISNIHLPPPPQHGGATWTCWMSLIWQLFPVRFARPAAIALERAARTFCPS